MCFSIFKFISIECSSLIDHCNKCTDDATCSECDEAFFWSGSQCIEVVTTEFGFNLGSTEEDKFEADGATLQPCDANGDPIESDTIEDVGERIGESVDFFIFEADDIADELTIDSVTVNCRIIITEFLGTEDDFIFSSIVDFLFNFLKRII